VRRGCGSVAVVLPRNAPWAGVVANPVLVLNNACDREACVVRAREVEWPLAQSAMRSIGPIALLLILCGCGAWIGDGVAGPPPMTGCDQTENFAFVGETSLDALGLGRAQGPDDNRLGMVWVTAEAVSMDLGMPAPPPPPGGGDEPLFPPLQQEPSRMVCVQWPDGTGMAGTVDNAWLLPAGMEQAAERGSFTVAPLVIGAVIAVLVVASVLAFRGDRAAE